MKTFVLILAIFCSSLSFAKAIDLQIDLHSGNENEKKAEELIRGFAKIYDLSPYIFTKNILIQSRVISHSHPVLTLNTRQISEPDRYLALLLHEEIHWFFAANDREVQLKKFLSKMKEKYPKVPSRKDERAIALYKKMGFEVEGVRKRNLKYGEGQYVDTVVMGRFV